MTQDDFDSVTKLEVLKFEYGMYCVKILNRLVEELPLERWIAQGVEDGELSPTLLDDLFGDGEGAGWAEAQGLTIEKALGCWYGCERLIQALIERNRTDD